MMNTYRYATRALLTLCFFTVTIISTVSGEVIHFGSNMEYVPNEVSQRDYISDEDLLKVVEDIEQQQSGGGAGGSGEESSEGFFNFKRVPFREKTAKSYGIKRTSYHLNLENPQSTFPIGHRKIIRAFEEGLANSIRDLIVGLPDHDRIQIYIGSNRLSNSHTTANVSVDDTLQLDVMHIVVAKAIADDHPQVKSIKDSRNPLQKTLAQQLQEEARVPLDPCGLDQIKLFSLSYLPNMAILSFTKDWKATSRLNY